MAHEQETFIFQDSQDLASSPVAASPKEGEQKGTKPCEGCVVLCAWC